MKNTILIAITVHLLLFPFAIMAKSKKKSIYNLQELALPSEVKDLKKKAGSIFYSPYVKGKVLVPVNFWGKIKNTGLHFIPIDSSLIRGISLAGGPSSNSKIEKVRVSRVVEGEAQEFFFDLSKGGDKRASLEKLRPNDIVFIEQDNYLADRSYYTSLIGVFATVLSSILVYREVKK